MSEDAGGGRTPRMTLSRMVELLLARGGRDHSSVTLSRSAKGETMIEVTVRTGESEEVATVDEAKAHAVTVYDELRDLYPLAGDDAGSSVSITRNAKGDTQIDVSVKTGARSEAATIAAAEEQAAAVYERLRNRYPSAEGFTGAAPKDGNK